MRNTLVLHCTLISVLAAGYNWVSYGVGLLLYPIVALINCINACALYRLAVPHLGIAVPAGSSPSPEAERLQAEKQDAASAASAAAARHWQSEEPSHAGGCSRGVSGFLSVSFHAQKASGASSGKDSLHTRDGGNGAQKNGIDAGRRLPLGFLSHLLLAKSRGVGDSNGNGLSSNRGQASTTQCQWLSSKVSQNGGSTQASSTAAVSSHGGTSSPFSFFSILLPWSSTQNGAGTNNGTNGTGAVSLSEPESKAATLTKDESPVAARKGKKKRLASLRRAAASAKHVC